MIPDSVLKQILDNFIVPERWNDDPIRMHNPFTQTKRKMWRRQVREMLSLRFVCKQWDSAFSDVAARKVDLDFFLRATYVHGDTLVWILASMAKANSDPSRRLLQHAREAIQSIKPIECLSETDNGLWRAPFAAQMAYHGKRGLDSQLRGWNPYWFLNEDEAPSTATCFLPVMIFYGVEDLHDQIDKQENVNAEDEFFGTALFAAVYTGNEQATSKLLELGADVNALAGSVFESVLILASALGSTSIIELLLQAGANVNELGSGSEYGTALAAAVACDHKPALELLLAHGANPNLQPPHTKLAPLLVAAKSGNVSMVDRLLECEDIDVNFNGELMAPPLSEAFANGHGTVAERLASDPRIDKVYAYQMAAFWGNLNIVRLLVEQKGVHPDDHLGTAVLRVLESKSDDTATYILEKCSFDPNKIQRYSKSPLDLASENGLENAVRILLQKGADIDSRQTELDDTPLGLAAGNGHERVVNLLLEYGADPSSPPGDFNPLMQAASGGHPSIVKILLDQGVDVNHRGHRNMTALMNAAVSGNMWSGEPLGPYDVCRELLEAGCDVNAQNDFGVTALSFAVAGGRTEITRLLITYGAQVDIEGTPPMLSRAVMHEHLQIVDMLLSMGADVNTPDDLGTTPLHWAVRNRQVEMVRLLLQREDIELDPRSPAVDDLTPLELAVREGYQELVTLLLERGAGHPKPLRIGSTPKL